MPKQTGELDGEVKNGIIYVYEPNFEKVINVLRHEVIDYCLTSRIVNPLINLVNLLIKSKETEIYKEKEKLVESILEFID